MIDSMEESNQLMPTSPARRTGRNTPSRSNSFRSSLQPTRLSNGSESLSRSANSSSSSLNDWLDSGFRVKRGTQKRRPWYQRTATAGLVSFVALILIVNSWMLFRIHRSSPVDSTGLQFRFLKTKASSIAIREELLQLGKVKKPHKTIYARLLSKAAHALADGQEKPEPKDLWAEPYIRASSWKPCADERDWLPSDGINGYLMVSANGGINQQRVAVCNAVAVARLLNATLVLPTFLYSSVWKDTSQFGDIYEEDYFINYLKPDIQIVRELPKDLQSLDLEAVGSVVTDGDIMKEAKPSFYLKHILPILLRNRVVHLIGFGNRLASDPIPFQLQRLRCRCNFHALRFVPKIQESGALLIQRMRRNVTKLGPLDEKLIGSFTKSDRGQSGHSAKDSKYLALHLRYEIDMVAHSLCDFGGGKEEQEEMEAYRAMHFPALVELEKTKKLPSPATLRAEGLCPLMPEETALMLAALGFKRDTPVFLAGAHIYGGNSRLASLTTLFPNLVTKEDLLSSKEIEPFMNFSSQLAALDFIACTAADLFAMTDSGSQFSSLISGYRVYYGGGITPTIRPNKRRLADIFVRNNTIEWKVFEARVRKAIRQNKRVFSRPIGRSVYRYPRCKDCMCTTDEET